MAELTEKLVEELASDLAVETEAVAKVVDSLLKIKISFAALGAAVGVTVGAVITYHFVTKRAAAKYAEIADKEIRDIRKHFMAKNDAKMSRIAKPDLRVMVNELGYTKEEQDAIDTVNKEAMEVEQEEHIEDMDPPINRNVFEEADPEVWDYAKEVKSRSINEPYIIHADEFSENENKYDRAVFTYYEQDDVLADHSDQIIEDHDDFAGLENLMKFGHGSNDPNVVYIRNDHLDLDMEINRSKGSYTEEVLGFKHADTSRRSRLEWDG